MSSTNPSAQSRRKLMDLPAEIRDMIWENVLDGNGRRIVAHITSVKGSRDPEIIVSQAFQGILACKQMVREARRFIEKNGVILDVYNRYNHVVDVDSIIHSPRCLDLINAAFFEFPGEEAFPDKIEPDEYVELYLLDSLLELPNLENIAIRYGCLLGCDWEAGHTVEAVRKQQLRRQRERMFSTLSMTLPWEEEWDEARLIELDDLFETRPDLRVFVDYSATTTPGCRGTCDVYNAKLDAFVEEEEDPCEMPRYVVGKWCDCKDTTAWYAIAIQEPDARKWRFVENRGWESEKVLEREFLLVLE